MKNLKRVLTLTLALMLTLTLLAPCACAADAEEHLGNYYYQFSNAPTQCVLVHWNLGADGPEDIPTWVYPDGTTVTWTIPDPITTSAGVIKRYDPYFTLLDLLNPVRDEETWEWESEYTEIVSGTAYPVSGNGITEYFVRYEEETPASEGRMASTSTRNVGYIAAITESYLALLESDDSGDISVKHLDGATIVNGWIVDTWAEESFKKAGSNGLVSSLLPNDLRENINRGDFAEIAVRLYEQMSGQEAPNPNDIPNPFEDWPIFGARQAYGLGIMNGISETKFGSREPLTREQAAVILARVYEKCGGTIPTTSATSFADNSDISGWAKSAVAFMAEKGILGGVGDNRFDPQGNCKCEEALIIALRMLETLK